MHRHQSQLSQFLYDHLHRDATRECRLAINANDGKRNTALTKHIQRSLVLCHFGCKHINILYGHLVAVLGCKLLTKLFSLLLWRCLRRAFTT